jgi:hypothetical protein
VRVDIPILQICVTICAIYQCYNTRLGPQCCKLMLHCYNDDVTMLQARNIACHVEVRDSDAEGAVPLKVNSYQC